MRSLRVSPRQSVASGFYCSVNRVGKKMVYATHVENPRNFSAWIKNVCAGKLYKPGASFTTQDTAARREGGGGDERCEVVKWMKARKLAVVPLDLQKKKKRQNSRRIQMMTLNLISNCVFGCLVLVSWDRQTDGVRHTETKTETVMHDRHYPQSPHWNQVIVAVEITITNQTLKLARVCRERHIHYPFKITPHVALPKYIFLPLVFPLY